MPCYKINTAPSGYGQIGTTGYATEAECLEACKEGACCNGTTCSVKPQCQCDAAQGFGFQGVGTTCSPNPCSVGACCLGPSCSQRSEEQCASFNIGTFFNPVMVSGEFVGDNIPCDPNPCCPGCTPPTQQNPSGKCCRSVYVDDGSGACCPNDCCGNMPPAGTPIAADGKNGACCPDAKPFCCTPDNAPNQRQCQSVLPTPCPGISSHNLSPCGGDGIELAGREMTFAVEAGQFTGLLIVAGTRLRIGAGRIHEADPLDVTVNYGNGFVPAGGNLFFCKPPGVTSITVRIGNVIQYIGPCGVGDQSGEIVGPECDCYRLSNADGTPVASPAWGVSFGCINGCACAENPLP